MKLVSIMAVNNETGAIQPIKEIVNLVRAKQPEVCIHVDAVQALGKIPVRPRELGVNLVSISAHKIHEAKGTGALCADRRDLLLPLIHGGGQKLACVRAQKTPWGLSALAVPPGKRRQTWRPTKGHVTGLRHQFLQGLQNLPCKVISPADGVPTLLQYLSRVSGGPLTCLVGLWRVCFHWGCLLRQKGQMSHVAEAMGLDGKRRKACCGSVFRPYNRKGSGICCAKIRQVLADSSFVRGGGADDIR